MGKKLLLLFSVAAQILQFGTAPVYGQSLTNWTLTAAPTNAWVAVAASANCSTIAAVANPGGIYYSLDSGTNWAQSDAATNNWTAIACSTDGTSMTAAINGGGIWKSADSGASWSLTSAPSNAWTGLACSADGTKIVATGPGGVWISTDFGQTWDETSLPTNTYVSAASSADGTLLAVVQSGESIWLSTNAGSSWTQNSAGYSWTTVTCSADGSKLVVIASFAPNYIVWVSTNDLASSEGELETGELPAVGGSADFSKLFVINGSSPVALTPNAGAAWVRTPSPGVSLTSLAVSSDGNEFVAIANGGGIYMWRGSSPLIAAQPQNQTVVGSSTVEFNVSAFTPVPAAYQWLYNGTPLQNATNSMLTLQNVVPAQSGSYSVIVSNSFGSALSSNALLTVAPAFASTQTPNQSLYDAYLLASVTPGSDSTTVWFEWGQSTNYGEQTQPIAVQGTSAFTISNLVTGLLPYTTYHAQAVVQNAFATVYGGDVSFTTVPRFVQAGTNTGMQAAVMAADGLHFAATMNGTVYTSTNLGVTFLPTSGTGTVFAVSSNGSAILATNNGPSIFVSTNYGLSWVSNRTPVTFSYFATSSDVKRIVASDGSTSVYMSTNFGATWTTNTVPMNVLCLASSANGNDLYAGAWYHEGYDINTIYLYSSINAGATWGTTWEWGGVIGIAGIACSANGSIIGIASEATFVSVNGGATFNGFIGPDADNFISCSGDGQTMIVSAEQYNVNTTPDAGNNFYTANTPIFLGNAKAMCSADGRTLALFNGSLYLSLPPPNEPFVLSSAAATSNGIPSFLLTGPAGYTCDIQASTNFISWTDIATVTNFGASTIFTDPNAPNYQYRFYRAIVP